MNAADTFRERWQALWPDGATGAIDALYRDLVARYAEPQRAYHTLDHITDCLRWLDEVSPLLARPREAELALWFHDAVYDPRRADNEERSAALAAEALRGVGVGEDVVERIAGLIRLTSHTAAELTGDGALVCDVDLAILGATPERFAQYDAAIRREYAWVPEEVYRRERGRVLEGFLTRPHIYHTSYFANALEQRARANLSTAIRRHQNGTLMTPISR